jgi:hypothetical protein
VIDLPGREVAAVAAAAELRRSAGSKGGEFLQEYILSRPDVKPATLEGWQQPCRNLTEFFGED